MAIHVNDGRERVERGDAGSGASTIGSRSTGSISSASAPRLRMGVAYARMTIDGWAATEFEPVLDAFARNFDERGEVGAAVCVYLDGQPVVDAWGGVADARTNTPWQRDSIVLVY